MLAYELVLRPRRGRLPTQRAAEEPAEAEARFDREAADVIVATAVDVGLEAVVGTRLTMVEVGRPFLSGALPVPFPAAGVLLVVRAALVGDPARLAGVARLRDAGFRVAARLGTPDHPGALTVAGLLDLCSAVLVDAARLDDRPGARRPRRRPGPGAAPGGHRGRRPRPPSSAAWPRAR